VSFFPFPPSLRATHSTISGLTQSHNSHLPCDLPPPPAILECIESSVKIVFRLHNSSVTLTVAKKSVTTSTMITVVWDMTMCSLTDINQRFGGTCGLHLQGQLQGIPSMKTESSVCKNLEAGGPFASIIPTSEWQNCRKQSTLLVTHPRFELGLNCHVIAQVGAQGNACRTSGPQTGTGAGFSPSILGFPYQLSFHQCPIVIYCQGLVLQAHLGLQYQATQSHPTPTTPAISTSLVLCPLSS
jgi:hypothetical protein